MTDERASVLQSVRRSVRGVLESTPAFAQAAPALRLELAKKMVTVAMMGADLVADEKKQTARVAPATAPIAQAQEFGEAARAAGRTFQDIRQAIDFPTYVQSLITGVFQAITTSNIQQLTAIGDMLDAVARTEDEFTSENIRDGDVVAWAVQKFPFVRAHEGGLAVREGVDISEKTGELAAQLRASESEVSGVDGDDLMSSLGPLIRRRIGRERQQMLATMVQMGLQRVVVDEGRLHASMDMRVDTRSALQQQRARREELDIDTGASASFGMGMWGAAAHLNVGYNKIESEASTSREEIDTRAGLRSSVDLAFRTDQIPLDRMASPTQRAHLDANARVPTPVAVAEPNTPLIAADAPAASLPSMERSITRDDRDITAARTAQEAARTRETERETQARADRDHTEQRADAIHTRDRTEAREDAAARAAAPPPADPPPPPPPPPPEPARTPP